MTTYLCTCGTSAAKNLPREARFGPIWVGEQGGVEAAARTLHRSFGAYRIDDDAVLQHNLSAEIHSLARMGVDATDNVVLFSSETADGQACATAVQRYLQAERPGIECRVQVIEGLQVRDATAFRTKGVVNFTKAVLREIDAHGPSQCVLNPTGGFKSLVPYTVLIGMIRGVPAKYIFEQSTALISLPAMPVEFARERIEPIRPLLERIDRESAIPRGDLDRALPYEERAILGPLFEEEGGEVTLSPVGFLVWGEITRPSALVPYLSRRALEDFLRVRELAGVNPVAYLQRVSRDSAQLDVARHINTGEDLFWLKPGNTKDRYLASVEGWRLLVWRITDHDEYEDIVMRQRSGDASGQMRRERRSRYEPFVRLDLYETE